MASRLTAEKNIPFALEVFKIISRMYSHIGLVIVGEGPEKEKLESMVKKLHLHNNVYFEPWSANLPEFYKTANMFLLTSNYEGYGLTLVEAIASGCPALSTDVGIANVLLQDGISLVCPIGDTKCFVEKISQLIEDIGLRLNFAQEAGNRLSNVAITDKQVYLERYKANIESALKR
jgi:glycosyltransferase involved in cell wall biosynthesis